MMKNNYGYIINIASVAAFVGSPKMWSYGASKSALLSFSETLRMELRRANKNGITVTAVCPWHISTQMFEGFNTKLHSLLPSLKPEYVAKEVMKAASDRQFLVFLPKVVAPLLTLKL